MPYKVDNFGKQHCLDCGNEITKNSPNHKRCPSCALKAHQETRLFLSPRPCKRCGETIFDVITPCQHLHPKCRRENRKDQTRERARLTRLTSGMIPMTTVLECVRCGQQFVRNSGFQKLCKICSKENDMKYRADMFADKWVGIRLEILKRDHHHCQNPLCEATENLHIHHIDGKGFNVPESERDNSPDNLIALCCSCHSRVHVIIKNSIIQVALRLHRIPLWLSLPQQQRLDKSLWELPEHLLPLLKYSAPNLM